jgi:hypothetical protein
MLLTTLKTIQIPYISQYKCSMVMAFPSLIQRTGSEKQMQYVCCACYASQGGHLHYQKATGDNDTTAHQMNMPKIQEKLSNFLGRGC